MDKKLSTQDKRITAYDNYSDMYYPFQTPSSILPFTYPSPYIDSFSLPYYQRPYSNSYSSYPPVCPSGMYQFIPRSKEQQHTKHSIKQEIPQEMISNCIIKIQAEQRVDQTSKKSASCKQLIEPLNISKPLLKKQAQIKAIEKEENVEEYFSIFQKLIEMMLEQRSPTYREIQFLKNQIVRNTAQNKLFDEIVQIINKKFKQFKKTKEELIKYIIRRTYHNLKIDNHLFIKPEYQRLELFHERNLMAHRSMNSEFIRKQFSNPLFTEVYKNFIEIMESQFDDQNSERIQRMSYFLTKCWAQKSVNDVQYYKKLPWLFSYKQKTKKMAVMMMKQYDGSSATSTIGQNNQNAAKKI